MQHARASGLGRRPQGRGPARRQPEDSATNVRRTREGIMGRPAVARSGGLALLLLALAACSSGSDVSPAQSAQQVLTAALVDKYPACAGRTSTDQNASASCSVDGHTYLLYVAPPRRGDSARELAALVAPDRDGHRRQPAHLGDGLIGATWVPIRPLCDGIATQHPGTARPTCVADVTRSGRSRTVAQRMRANGWSTQISRAAWPAAAGRARPSRRQGQVTFGFQSANMPAGLCFQIHACSS